MDKKISQLTTATTPLAGTEVLPIVQSGQTVKSTVQDVLGYVVNDSTNSVLKTVYSANAVGLKLDFANQIYSLGDKAGINAQGLIEINQYDISLIGQNENVIFTLQDNNKIIKSTFGGDDIGLKLDFANNQYYLGSQKLQQYITENNIGLGSFSLLFNNTDINGIAVDFSDVNTGVVSNVSIGDFFGANNGTFLQIYDAAELIKTSYQGNDIGLKLDFATSTYQFGQLTGGNATYLTIDDAAAYPVQVNGTNVSANTAGAASGQFLKIKVKGVDYKIALLNP